MKTGIAANDIIAYLRSFKENGCSFVIQLAKYSYIWMPKYLIKIFSCFTVYSFKYFVELFQHEI